MRRVRAPVGHGVVALLLIAGLVVGKPPAVHTINPMLPTRALLLKANDLVYDPVHSRIYATVPGTEGAIGNSIMSIDPTSGMVVSSVFAGSDPTRLAISDDSSMLYVGLNGSNSVRQYSLPGLSLVREIFLGTSGFTGLRFAWDIEVMPGQPNTIAVSRILTAVTPGENGVAIFDAGIQRPTTTPGGIDSSLEIAFDNASLLYGLNLDYGAFRPLTVDAGGVTQGVADARKVTGRIVDAGGRVYGTNGAVVDPASNTLLGTFPVVDFGAFAIDAISKRAYYLDSAVQGVWTLHVFNTDTFAETGTYPVPAMDGPTSLVVWGGNSVAYASRDGRVFIASPGTVAQPIPTVMPPPEPPAYPFKLVNQTVGQLTYDSTHGVLYGSVPAAASTAASTIVEIDPTTQSVVASTASLSGVDPIVLSDDDSMLYAGLRGTGEVAQFSLPGLVPVRQFSLGTAGTLGQAFPNDIAVMPGQPSTIAVAEYWPGVSPPNAGTVIFDSGVQRPVTAPSHIGADRIEFGSPTRLYGLDTCCSGNESQRLSVDTSGVSYLSRANHLLEGYDIQYAGGRLYSSSGRVADPEAETLLGTFPVRSGLFFVDAANGRSYAVWSNSFTSTGWRLTVSDTSTFRLLETYALPDLGNGPSSLVRWGSDGLAVATVDGPVVLLSKSFPGPSGPPPPPPPPPPDQTDAFGEYTALPPQRLLDTRITPGPLAGGATIDVPIVGVAGVPSSDVVAVVLNVTATGPLQPGFLTVFPSDEPLPTVSNVNYVAGQTVPNLVTVPLSLDGSVTIFSSAHTDVVVDLEGYYSDSRGTPGGRFRPTEPTRLFDTRDGSGGFGTTFGPSTTRSVDVRGRAGLPPAGAVAVVMNVTVTRPTAPGFLTVFPGSSTLPTVSDLNFVPGQTVPNLVIVEVPPSGVISFFNSRGDTDVIADVVGYFDEDRSDESGRFVPFVPERLYDSRESTPDHPAAPLGPGESLVYSDQLLASAYVLNVTATEPTSAGYLTVYPFPGDVPLASNLNFVAGQTVANLAYAPAGPDVGFFNSAGNTHIVVDLFGAFT